MILIQVFQTVIFFLLICYFLVINFVNFLFVVYLYNLLLLLVLLFLLLLSINIFYSLFGYWLRLMNLAAEWVSVILDFLVILLL